MEKNYVLLSNQVQKVDIQIRCKIYGSTGFGLYGFSDQIFINWFGFIWIGLEPYFIGTVFYPSEKYRSIGFELYGFSDQFFVHQFRFI